MDKTRTIVLSLMNWMQRWNESKTSENQGLPAAATAAESMALGESSTIEELGNVGRRERDEA